MKKLSRIHKVNRLLDIKNPSMEVLLIVNRGHSHDMKVLVRLQTVHLIEQVRSLMSAAKEEEAFDVVFSHGQVMEYIPAGKKSRINPEFTLVEDVI